MNDASNIGNFVLAAIQVITLVVMLRKLTGFERREIHPQPLSVRQADDFITTAACQKAHAEFERRMASNERRIEQVERQLQDRFEKIQASGEERAGKLHSRVNDVLGEVRELRGMIEARMLK